MGQKLVQLYKFAEQAGGVTVKTRLAMKTGLMSAKAADTPDSPENIQKLKAAIKELTGKEATMV